MIRKARETFPTVKKVQSKESIESSVERIQTDYDKLLVKFQNLQEIYQKSSTATEKDCKRKTIFLLEAKNVQLTRYVFCRCSSQACVTEQLMRFKRSLHL